MLGEVGMARFRKFRAPKITTVIGRETELRGDLRFHGGLHVDGSIKGDVSGMSDDAAALILSESGRVEGDVRVANVVLNGTVIGDVYASGRAELAPQARVTGTLYYRLLEMAMGAEVNGQLVRMEEEETRMLSYDGSGDGPIDQASIVADSEAGVVSEDDGSDSGRARRGRIQ
jgi:cytoskeletal protein CcmA (bactofilin family)